MGNIELRNAGTRSSGTKAWICVMGGGQRENEQGIAGLIAGTSSSRGA